MDLKKTLTASAAVAALLAGTSAQASEIYISLFGGISTFDDDVQFNQSRYNSGTTYGPSYVSRKNIKTGPLYFSTTVPTTTTRKIGYYFVNASLFVSTHVYHQSYFNWHDDFDNGFVVGAAIGFDLAPSWRTELELAYRQADVDNGGSFNGSIDGTVAQFYNYQGATKYTYRYFRYNYVFHYYVAYTGPTATGFPVGSSTTGKKQTYFFGSYTVGPYTAGSNITPNTGSTVANFTSNGEAKVWSIMANLWYDFDIGDSNFHPFIGGGIGAAHLDLEYNAAMPTYFGSMATYRLDDSGWGFAYQVGAGLGYDLGGGVMLSAQYRYFATTDIDVGNTDLAVNSHNFLVGLNIPLGGY